MDLSRKKVDKFDRERKGEKDKRDRASENGPFFLSSLLHFLFFIFIDIQIYCNPIMNGFPWNSHIM